MTYVDSNYWIYWLDSRLPEHKRASALMREVVEGEVLMSYVTLIEIGHYLRLLPKAEFSEKMGMILNLSTLKFVDLNDAIARRAMDLLPRFSGKGLGGRDCVIIATMETRGLKDILTHDKAFAQVEWLHVTDVLP